MSDPSTLIRFFRFFVVWIAACCSAAFISCAPVSVLDWPAEAEGIAAEPEQREKPVLTETEQQEAEKVIAEAHAAVLEAEMILVEAERDLAAARASLARAEIALHGDQTLVDEARRFADNAKDILEGILGNVRNSSGQGASTEHPAQ